MIFRPHIYQRLIADFVLNHERCNVFAGMGMGKTTASIYAFDAMRMFGEAQRALVFAPRRVALNTWPGEFSKWGESFGHLSVAACVGTPAQRLAALRSGADVTTINYDNIEWLIEQLGDAWDFDTVFADESTRLKALRISIQRRMKKDGTWGNEFITGQGGKRAKMLAHVAHKKVRRWVNLTGSPAPNGLQDLWGQQWFVDAGRRLGNSFTSFEQRWFYYERSYSGHSRPIPHAHAQGEIERFLRECSITIDPKDYFDLKDPIPVIRKIKLPPAARKVYDDMEKKLFAEIKAGVNVEAVSAGSKLQKCMQIANGAVFDEERKWHEVHDEKIEALRSVVEEFNGEPILVRYTHTPDRDRILKAFPRFKYFDDKPSTEKAWNDGKIPGLVTHAASAGHGSNLQYGGRVLCDFATDHNLEHDEQIIERIGPMRQMQIGRSDRAVYRVRLIAEDTVEEAALMAVRRKASVQDSLKAAMKLREDGGQVLAEDLDCRELDMADLF
jgi:SNF2 family DNA or RNA helicase